jgi:hypothetical protein
MTTGALPDVGAILAPLLGAVAPGERPLLLAIAERMAAERYRAWAARVDAPDLQAGLLACAAREDEIASRVEAVHLEAVTVQARLRAEHPELETITAELFGSRPLSEQFAIQASGERLGAGTWRAFAAAESDPTARAAYLACAPLEEASAEFLQSVRT